MSNLYKLFALIILLSAFAGDALGQHTLSGKVTDTNSGEELIGATIMELGTSNGVVTDLDGAYSMTVSSANVQIEISYVGYQTQTIAIGARSVIDIELEEDSELLSEVVVIGYGEQRKKVATASISKVTAKDLEKFSVPNVSQSLQGQVSGVIFKATSGQPGAVPQILIRGIGTNDDSNPLVVIDGLIYDDPSIMQAINPNDVETINVLKDGASTAIYGTRGANGIIIITTKGSKEGEGTLTYSNTFGMQSAWKVPEVLNRDQYVELLTEKYENSGLTPPDDILNGASSPFDTDWFGHLFEDVSMQSHQISFAKGTSTSSFRASFSHLDQQGLIAPEKSNFERITARINADQQINDYITFGQNIFYTQTKGSNIPENNEFGTPIGDALVYDPLTPAFDANAQFGFGQSTLVQKEYINPLSRIFITNDSYKDQDLAGNAYLAIEPIENLTFKTDYSVRIENDANENFAPRYALTPAFLNETNDFSEYRETFTRWKWENTVNYKKQFGKNNFDIILGISAQEDNYENVFAGIQNIPDDVEFNPNFRVLDATNPIDTADVSAGTLGTRYAIASQFGRVLYNYDNKYLATFILRRDGSTRFGPENRYAIFPSASLGWVVSSEDFWTVPAINFLKIRVSYGQNGNDRIGDNRFRSVFAPIYSYQFGKPTDQVIYQGTSNEFSAQPNLKWEKSAHYDIGFEMGLLEDKVDLEFSYYRKETKDLLFEDPTAPLLVGTGAPTSNLGSFLNSGMELDVNYNGRYGEFDFNVGLNLTTLNNEVTGLNGQAAVVDLYSWPVRNIPITRMEVGEPVGFFRGYKTDGIFRTESDVQRHVNRDRELLQPNASPGDLKFVDINGDGEITSDDITKIGKPWADLTLGLNLGVSYKRLSLSTVWFASFGSEIYRTYERQDIPNNNYKVEWLDRYNENNTNGSYPRVSLSDPNLNSRPSDFYVESGNFLRLRNIQLSYSLPSRIIEKVEMKALKVFVGADNLLTITGYSGFDPEIGQIDSNNIGTAGLDRGFYPLARTISGGLSVTF